MLRSTVMLSAAALLMLATSSTAQPVEIKPSPPHDAHMSYDAHHANPQASTTSQQGSDASEYEAEASSADDAEHTEAEPSQSTQEQSSVAEYGIEGALSLEAEKEAQASATASPDEADESQIGPTASLDEPSSSQSSAAVEDSTPQAQPALGTPTEHPYVAPNFYTVQPTDMRGSDLIGMDVYNANNEKIGEIEDIVLDDGKNIKAIVLGVGGFLGVGERNVAVEADSVLIQKRAPDDERALVHATQESLESAPEYKIAHLGETSGSGADSP